MLIYKTELSAIHWNRLRNCRVYPSAAYMCVCARVCVRTGVWGGGVFLCPPPPPHVNIANSALLVAIYRWMEIKHICFPHFSNSFWAEMYASTLFRWSITNWCTRLVDRTTSMKRWRATKMMTEAWATRVCQYAKGFLIRFSSSKNITTKILKYILLNDF